MRHLRSFGLSAILAPAMLLASSPALAWHGHHSHVYISGGWYWGCPGPWGCGYAYAYGPPYSVPPPSYALVDTDISPEDARVVLDGEDLGDADDFDGFPGYLVVSPGKHVLEFRMPGYRPLQIRLQAWAGQYYDIDRKLTHGESVETDEMGEKPSTSSSRRPGAGSPDEEWLAPGEPAPGPETGSGGDSEPGPPQESGSARLVLRLRPDDAAVYIDGKLLGAGDGLGGTEGVTVETGRHTLEVVKPGFAPYRTTLVLQDGQVRSLSVRLEPD